MRETVVRINGTRGRREKFEASVILRDGLVRIVPPSLGPNLLGKTLGELGSICENRKWKLIVVHQYNTEEEAV